MCRTSIFGLLHHSSKPSTSYKRKIFLYDKGDFDSYRQQLTDVDWETLFEHDDVDTIVDIITNTILNKQWSTYIFFIIILFLLDNVIDFR
jgi:hypothetical protein